MRRPCCRCRSAPAAAAELAEAGNAPQHLDEQPGQRQVRPVRVGGDVEEDDLAVAALAAVTSGVPSLQAGPDLHVLAERAGSASTWRLTSHLGRRRAGRQTGCRRRTAPAAAASTTTARRRACGRRAATPRAAESSPPFSRRGPAKRTSTPPFLTQVSTRSLRSPDSVPMSAIMSTETFCLTRPSMAVGEVGVLRPRPSRRTAASAFSM